jgi:hypothetical protein
MDNDYSSSQLTPDEIAFANRDPLSSTALVLPDSRMRDHQKGTIHGRMANMVDKLNWTPIFCANCGKPYGYVPTENCTFACWLCDPCADKWGTQYGLAFMPDEIFAANVVAEQMEKHGRGLTNEEVVAVEQSSCNSLSQLLREGK